MALIIDGYNLLHGSGILGRGRGPGSLERSRAALLNFLAESLSDEVLSRTVVVFDARDAPRGLPRTVQHRGLTVRFAEGSGEADELIEELIKANSSPRRLTVVSSDHRLHRAARRRNATPVDSDQWYHQIVQQRITRARSSATPPKPAGPISDVEVRFWLRQFGLEDEDSKDQENGGADVISPFPPGYAEDIDEENL